MDDFQSQFGFEMVETLIGKSGEVVGDSLDHLIGTWSSKQARQFLKSIAPLEQIDRSFWK